MTFPPIPEPDSTGLRSLELHELNQNQLTVLLKEAVSLAGSGPDRLDALWDQLSREGDKNAAFGIRLCRAASHLIELAWDDFPKRPFRAFSPEQLAVLLEFSSRLLDKVGGELNLLDHQHRTRLGRYSSELFENLFHQSATEASDVRARSLLALTSLLHGLLDEDERSEDEATKTLIRQAVADAVPAVFSGKEIGIALDDEHGAEVALRVALLAERLADSSLHDALLFAVKEAPGALEMIDPETPELAETLAQVYEYAIRALAHCPPSHEGTACFEAILESAALTAGAAGEALQGLLRANADAAAGHIEAIVELAAEGDGDCVLHLLSLMREPDLLPKLAKFCVEQPPEMLDECLAMIHTALLADYAIEIGIRPGDDDNFSRFLDELEGYE